MSPLTQAGDEVGAPGGGVATSGGAHFEDRLLSVAEIQQALLELRARRPHAAAPGMVPPTRLQKASVSKRSAPALAPVPPAHRSRREGGATARPAGDDTDRERWAGGGDETPRRAPSRGDSVRSAVPAGADIDAPAADWLAVAAAHAGAGASTVALAISDAAAATDQRVHLVEGAPTHRSGLVAAASAELGTDTTGAWRRGSRGRVTIDRRIADVEPGHWPVLPTSEKPAVTVLDLGLPAPNDLTRLAADRTRTVVVCRPTLPGVRLTEHVLSQLAEQPVVVAVVGPARWPQMMKAHCGPRFRELQSRGRVVRVPVDRRLQIAGLTGDRLPKAVEAAGRSLATLLMPTAPSQPRLRREAASPRPAAAGDPW